MRTLKLTIASMILFLSQLSFSATTTFDDLEKGFNAQVKVLQTEMDNAANSDEVNAIQAKLTEAGNQFKARAKALGAEYDTKYKASVDTAVATAVEATNTTVKSIEAAVAASLGPAVPAVEKAVQQAAKDVTAAVAVLGKAFSGFRL